MKKSVLFVLFALISVAGFSQITGWNAKVGMNFSNYTGDLDLNAKVGFKLGGGFEYAFTDTWSLQPSLFLTSKGAKKDGNSINAMYLELPVMAAARFNVADNTNLVGDLDLNAKVGFKLGGGFEYAFTDTWSLQPSLFLTSKGAKKDGNSINAMYLELPVMAAARFNVADNTNLVVNAGPYFACGIAGKTKFDLGNDTERKVDTFGDDALKRFDAGLGVGVALEFGRIIAGLDGQFGLVDVEKVGNPKNMNFSIIVGYKF